MRVVIGLGSCGIAAGAQDVKDAIAGALTAHGVKASLEETGCNGACHREPIVEVYQGGTHWTYGGVTVAQAEEIVEKHLKGGAPIEEWTFQKGAIAGEVEAFFSKQKRIALGNCGVIDPEKIEDYLAQDGYTALTKALADNDRDQVIAEMLASGLRGRGGGGFPTGLKWKFTKGAVGDQKYIICNADEGDPGAFMDRSILEGDPHAVLEGMAIAGFATGATAAYVYCRAEYPLAIKRLNNAIAQAKEKNLLGKNILGSDFSFDIKVKEGAGAFVCGEETALMASIEGMRGMPRPRPPFPAQSGLWGHPTNINNVETFANIPWIMVNGASSYASVGTEKSKGSKVFALAGRIQRGGLAEVPMGITIREIVNDVAGGSSSGLPIKAVQMGGPSGGCIPASLFDTRIDYDEVNKTGAIMGSGGLVVMDETTCMVDVARFFLSFTRLESCGKCTFCRIGTTRMLEILEKICAGDATMDDLDVLADLSEKIKKTSLCGLGQTAPNPVLTTLKYFRHEYEAHIKDKKCPAGVCKALTIFHISPEKCTGCSVCAINCSVKAISGERGVKGSYSIDEEKCTKCGVCRDVCKFQAVYTD
ncbi:NADH-quinone oxidoreductase subunit NuoF [Myxococcota bacterium]|nr:NADH-quinone oxidoreductase subunit NuoF [Myxococcota bacterium]